MAAHQRIAELNKLAAMLGTGIGNRRGRKHLDVLAGLLRDDEEPLALVYGLAKDSRLKDVIGVAMATNERFVFYGTLVGKVENVSYPISNITTARVERRITTNELIGASAGSTFLMRNVVLVAAE